MVHKVLLGEVKNHFRRLLAVVVVSVVNGCLAVGQAWLIAVIINKVFLGNGDLGDVQIWLGLLAALIVIRAVFVWLGDKVAHSLADCIKQDVRQRVINRLCALGPVPLTSRHSGDLVNMLTEGIENLEAYFARYLPQLVTAALVPILILGVVAVYDQVSALLMVVSAPLIPFFMVLIGRAAEKLNKQQWETLSRLNAHFLDVLQGLTTLKLFGRSKEQTAVIARMAGDFRDTTLRVLRVAFLSSLTLELIATISTALVAVTVGVKLLFGELEFSGAFFVLLLAPEFFLPLRQLGTHFHAGMAGAAAAEQIYRILAIPEPSQAAGSLQLSANGAVSVSFDDVHFSYAPNLQPALNGVSFTIGAGERVALVGATGAGKTTIAGLLLRFIDHSAGRILVNGHELTRIDREGWLANVAYVPQNPHLFSGTVADNIAFGQSVSREAIEAAAAQAQAHGFISQLPQGYDTVVGEGGRSLSGGERQRLAIARALLRGSPFVILDEATANLDPHTEELIGQALDKLLAGRTALIIAHRLTTVRKADRILVLKAGRVAEMGTHDELINRQGEYFQLATAFRGEGAR